MSCGQWQAAAAQWYQALHLHCMHGWLPPPSSRRMPWSFQWQEQLEGLSAAQGTWLGPPMQIQGWHLWSPEEGASTRFKYIDLLLIMTLQWTHNEGCFFIIHQVLNQWENSKASVKKSQKMRYWTWIKNAWFMEWPQRGDCEETYSCRVLHPLSTVFLQELSESHSGSFCFLKAMSLSIVIGLMDPLMWAWSSWGERRGTIHSSCSL